MAGWLQQIFANISTLNNVSNLISSISWVFSRIYRLLVVYPVNWASRKWLLTATNANPNICASKSTYDGKYAWTKKNVYTDIRSPVLQQYSKQRKALGIL